MVNFNYKQLIIIHMPTKTVIERQIQIYGQFQSEIRKSSKEVNDRYAPEGSAGWLRHQEKVRAYDKRYAEREKALKEFMKTEPVHGSLKGLTSEDVAKITQDRINWKKELDQFKKDLDKRLPKIVL
jgi:hypothetical protein